MAEKTEFRNLPVNSIFLYQNETYKKVETVRISCCKSINAYKVSGNSRVFVPENAQVEIKQLT